MKKLLFVLAVLGVFAVSCNETKVEEKAVDAVEAVEGAADDAAAATEGAADAVAELPKFEDADVQKAVEKITEISAKFKDAKPEDVQKITDELSAFATSTEYTSAMAKLTNPEEAKKFADYYTKVMTEAVTPK